MLLASQFLVSDLNIYFLRQCSNNTHAVSTVLTAAVHLLLVKLSIKCNFRSKPPMTMNMERILLFY